MSGDLSILFYTANRLRESFAHAVRCELRMSLDAYAAKAGVAPPVIVVSQSGTPDQEQAIVADLAPVAHVIRMDAPFAIVQVYRNLLAACDVATTPFCAAAEDDCLYVSDHWKYRPAPDTFAYNEHRVVLSRRLSADGRRREAFYWFRTRTQMAQGIFARDLMIETLREKFTRYPDPPLDTTVAKKAGFGEPGRYERNLGLTRRKIERVPWTAQPTVTINHSGGLMGRRRVNADDQIFSTVEPWGEANALWSRIHG